MIPTVLLSGTGVGVGAGGGAFFLPGFAFGGGMRGSNKYIVREHFIGTPATV